MNSDLPTVFCASQQDWEAWLEANHERADEIWIKLARKKSGVASVSLDEAQETALCFGWVDGRAAPIDDDFWSIRFTPRRPMSNWSKINRERANKLAAQGRLKPAGLREIEAAKRDGRWAE